MVVFWILEQDTQEQTEVLQILLTKDGEIVIELKSSDSIKYAKKLPWLGHRSWHRVGDNKIGPQQFSH